MGVNADKYSFAVLKSGGESFAELELYGEAGNRGCVIVRVLLPKVDFNVNSPSLGLIESN